MTNPKPGWVIHYTELPPPRGGELATEWEVYRREVGRWLAEGREGQCVLIKGEDVIGFFPTRDEAIDEGWRRFPFQPIMTHYVREWEPLIRQGMAAAWPR